MPILLPDERIGTLLAGRYRIERIIGRGGMGAVFAALHVGTGRPVAVKVLLPEMSDDAVVQRRFLVEMRASAAVRHPHAVEVIDAGVSEDGSLYLALERLTGESLADRLGRERRLDAATTLAILLPVLDALAAAHAAGILHRDLKPGNLFLAVDARGATVPKLLDFGIAKVREASASLTATGSMLGTPRYMAPEQSRGEREIGPPADVWSMGVLAYECLAGVPPFDAELMHAVIIKAMTQPHAPLATRAPECPEGVAAVVDRCLAKGAGDRPADAAALALALREAAARGGLTVPARVAV